MVALLDYDIVDVLIFLDVYFEEAMYVLCCLIILGLCHL